MEKKDFIELILEPAKYIMRKYNILASLTMAQAILESGWGESESFKLANNVFVTKGEYNNEYIELEIPEVINKTEVPKMVKIKKYPSIKECFEDRTNMLLNIKLNKKEYKYRNIINIKNYKELCKTIQKDGYNTVENYAETLINIIDENKLYQIDKDVFEKPNIDVSNVKPGDNPTHHIIDFEQCTIAKEDQYRIRTSSDATGKEKGTYTDKDEAIRICNKYIGYNVYTTNGILIHKSTAKDLITKNKPNINNIVIIKGMVINIVDTPLYNSSTSDNTGKVFSGKYYIYDGIPFGTRYRVTSKAEYVGKGSQYVIGFIDKKSLKLKQ